MFVNILRIASPLEFSLPSFLPSRKRSLFSSFKKTVFSDIEFSNFFLFFEIKQGFFNSSIQKNRPSHSRFNNDPSPTLHFFGIFRFKYLHFKM